MAEQCCEWVFPGKPTCCSACRGRRQVILNYNPGPSRRLHDRVVSSARKTFIVDMSFARLQWSGRKFFHFLSGSLDYGSNYELGYMGHLWVVSAISWRSSTERRKKTYSWTTQRSSTDCLDFLHLRRGLWLDRSGIEGASSIFIIESSGLMKHEVWIWVIWEIFELYVLFLCGAVGRSTILRLSENRWKCKRLDVLYSNKKQQNNPNKQQATHHPETKKISSELSVKATLVRNRDGHFLATLSALKLLQLEGKTDCPISVVFGAGKTRAAAATVAGLITVAPTLKIMILAKENVASQTFADRFERLNLPSRSIWVD